MQLEDNYLLSLNKRGLIPGPNEQDEAFLKRVSQSSAKIEQTLIPLYDIAPDWVDIVHNSKNLHFWEGAATWVDSENTTIQIGNHFLARLYNKQEILQHELVHAARTAFEEPIFEEALAYRTSQRKWRRLLGPIFQSPKETLLILLLLLLTCLHTLFVIPLMMTFFFGVYRLVKKHLILFKCAKNLQTTLHNKESLWPVLMRLSDHEIIFFSSASTNQIISYITKQKKITLRWRVIALAYIKRTLTYY